MTICVGIKVNDGIVFVADSATTLLSPNGNGSPFGVRVYNHADKVFNLYRGQPIVSMTCGLGNFGNESIATISKCIRDKLMSIDGGINPLDYTVQSVVEVAYEEFRSKYEPLDAAIKAHSSFEYFIAGFPSNSNRSEIWKIVFSNGETPEPVMLVDSDSSDIIWAGQPEACIRLVLGVSSQTQFVLNNIGLTSDQSEQLHQSIINASRSPFLVNSMPMPDAISLAEFLASTTVNFVKFMPGADTVGGSLDIATITKYEGFKWIKRKHFYPIHLNGETDHVR
ncbi:hypothetical protein FHS77_002699 [Paenochrobactrum gallinarii]|uniref:Uncharacterized protein n=1 Tax=Paenochrobactrum gallinarii TaxID=643673 RepID=A0A841M7A0_9HYPH|nr:hypothetical protein [Paenochrobactrum gallinarii]MBB6262131.1 hypothetical protein [Paenochrobactrum gallinarii]